MRYKVDHDYHIHSMLSSCSRDPEQTVEYILSYAEQNALTSIAVTDHYWDEVIGDGSKFYQTQNFAHISKSLPLPKSPNVRFLFGCEGDLRRDLTLGIPNERFDSFDMIVIPTTHLHMNGFTVSADGSESCEERARLWCERLEAVLNMDLPFNKVGIAHLACYLINKRSDEDYLKTLSLIPESEATRLFTKAASLGVGIELNADDLRLARKHGDIIMRIFRTAKKCGCKFYLGSDAHTPKEFTGAIGRFEWAIDRLDLSEDDKFIPGK